MVEQSNEPRRVAGLDVGYAATGVVVFENARPIAAEACKTEPSSKKRGIRQADDDARRCGEMFRSLVEILTRYNVRAVAAESPSGGAKSAKAMAAMARAQAIVACLAEAYNLPIYWVSPTDLKKTVVGKKTASKEEVQESIKLTFQDSQAIAEAAQKAKNQWEHLADAAGAYLTARDEPAIRLLEEAV